jgi:hypothetical protein
MYGLGPVPFKDGCAVASIDMSTEYEVILLTSEERSGKAGTIWDRAGQAGAKQPADKVSDCEKVRGEESWYPTSRKKRARCGAPGVLLGGDGKKSPQGLKPSIFSIVCGPTKVVP